MFAHRNLSRSTNLRVRLGSATLMRALFLAAIFGLLPVSGFCDPAPPTASAHPFFVYNFGRLTESTPADQVALLRGLGYDGISLGVEDDKSLQQLDEYFAAADATKGAFRIFGVYVFYRFDRTDADRDRWKLVLDKIAGHGADLWVIFAPGLPATTDAEVAGILGTITDAAKARGVTVVLYPHNNCYFPTAESALPMVRRLDRPNLGLALHLCHELRAGNGDRIEEVAAAVAPYVRFASISGADSVVDWTTPALMSSSSIKPLDEGGYDLQRYVNALRAAHYQGPVGFINHTIAEEPKDYLARSIKSWKQFEKASLTAASVSSKPESKVAAFDAPDQAVWHQKTRSWFVSNLGGGISLARDGYGWIARLDETGKVVSPRWLDGFDAPSGMVATEDTLYVCDRSGLVEVDIPTAKVRKKYPLPEASFVNDVARSENGDLYISDFFGNRIYRIPSGSDKPEIFVEGEELDTPDGLLVDGGTLFVAAWGKLTDRATFATSKLGRVLAIDLKTRSIQPFVKNRDEIGNLEGLAKVGDALYATDWARGALLRITREGATDILTGLSHPSDPGYSPQLGTIAIPEHGTNRVLFLKVAER